MKPRWRLLLALCMASACVSAPKIDYYTLAMRPSGAVETTDSFVVDRFRTGQALSRPQILIAASATRVEYYATDHWAADLGELVQQKLAVELGPTVEGRRTLVVSGTLLAFEQVDGPAGAEAHVRLEVEVRDAARKRYEAPLVERTYEARRPAAGPAPAAVVEALSRCVEELAAQIARDASSS